MYIYIVYSFCTTLPIAWQSICDLRSCKAMTLVRFKLSFYIFSLCVFFSFFFSLTSFVSAGSERGGSDPAVMRWKELEHWIWHFSSRQSVSVLTSPAVPPFWEYWKYIRYCKRREKKEHSLHGHATSGGQQTNRRPSSSPSWAKSGWTDNDDEEMRWSPSPCPRERAMALILAWWHTTGQPLGC